MQEICDQSEETQVTVYISKTQVGNTSSIQRCQEEEYEKIHESSPRTICLKQLELEASNKRNCWKDYQLNLPRQAFCHGLPTEKHQESCMPPTQIPSSLY